MTKRANSATLEESARRVVVAAERPLQVAFLSRALNALAKLTPDLDDHALGEAAGAASDYATLLRALERPEVLAVLREEDPLGPARVRGLRAKMNILQAEGGTLSVQEVAGVLGVTRQAVDKRRRAGRLLGIDLGRRGYAYPAWQFGPVGVLPGLTEVLAAFVIDSPWMQASWFLSENLYLAGDRPLDVLRRGEVSKLVRAAQAFGEHGAA